MAKSNKLIFIDLDGTLIDVSQRWYSLHVDLSHRYEYKPLPKSAYLNLKRAGIKESLIIGKTAIAPEVIGKYTQKRIELIETTDYLKKDELKAGALQFLEKLSKVAILILVTKRKNKVTCREELARLDIARFFSKIIIAGTLSKSQSIRRIFKSQEYKHSLLIGDTEDDYLTAKKLGMRCILVCDNVHSKKRLAGLEPDYIIGNLR